MPITAVTAVPISARVKPEFAIISSLTVLTRDGAHLRGDYVLVYQLLGGREPDAQARGIRLKFVVGAVEPELAAQRAHRMVKLGWRAIKVKVARHEHPQVDVDRLKAVREAIGPNTWLSVDANGGYTVDQAIWAAARFEKLNVALFEQPTRRGDH